MTSIRRRWQTLRRRRVPCVITNIVSNGLINLTHNTEFLAGLYDINGRRSALLRQQYRRCTPEHTIQPKSVCCHEHTAQPKWGAGAAHPPLQSSIRLIRLRGGCARLPRSCNTRWAWSMSWNRSPIPLLPLLLFGPTSWSRNAGSLPSIGNFSLVLTNR